jgi:DNA sulfur modification protein DndD
VIVRLDLPRFGRFRGQSFPLKLFTFFYGSNESGKTTIFDALFQEICSPRANRRQGRLLAERYGEAREAALTTDGAPLSIDEDEFLNLYAIRSGDIHFELDSPAAYMEKVKAELYSGGIDPGLLARRFAALASGKKTYRHMQELAALRERQSELETLLEQLQEKRQSILAEEQDIHGREGRLAGIEEKLARSEKRVRELEDVLGGEKKIIERRELDSLLALIERSRGLESELRASPASGADETAELDRLLQEQTECRERLGRSRIRAEQLREELAAGRAALARLSARQADAFRLSARAGEMLARIEAGSAGLRPRIRWKHGLLLAALLFFLAALAVAVFSRLPQLLIALAGLLGALMLLLLARGRAPLSEQEAAFISRLKDEYRNFSGEHGALESGSLAGIVQELQKRRLQADLLAAEVADKTKTIGDLEARLGGKEGEVRACELEAAEKKRAVHTWLEARSVSGRDAYLALRHDHRAGQVQLEELRRRLAEEMALREVDDTERLRNDCMRRLSELDREGIPRRGKTELEIRGLENELRAEQGDLEELRAEQLRLRTRQAGERGRISGSLGDLPERMVQCESELRQTGLKIAVRDEERQAAALLGDIFTALAGEAETNLFSLQQDLAAWFSELVPSAREVALQGLDTRSIRAADAGGDSRLLTHLSRGTRDAFMLAARLALVRKSRSGPGILILDEPFFALDARRGEKALRLLGRFQADHGWQIVILSKDEPLYRLAQTLFPDGQFNPL